MSLDIKAEVSKIRKMYEEDVSQRKFNLLLLGEHGSGKTFLARTAPKPVHIDSFDPGGTVGLRKWIERGEIIVDTRYEREDLLDPTAYMEWYKEFDYRYENGYFDHFATYWLDSATTWDSALLSALLVKKGGDPKAIPDYKSHYHYEKLEMRAYIRKMMNLPCNFVLTGHLIAREDQMRGRLRWRFLTRGDGAVILPTLFSEIYTAVTEETSKGVSYKLLTENIDDYPARSRLKADGLLETYEEPNLKKILDKAGLPSDDKPLIDLILDEERSNDE